MSTDQWQYRVAGIDFGPVDFEGLAALAAKGQLSADDEVSRDGTSWRRAGDIVGLIPEKVDDSCEFRAPQLAATDRRNGPHGGATTREPARPQSQTNRPKQSPKAFKDEVNSLLSLAETASADDIARSALSSEGMAISPQRGVRVQSSANASPAKHSDPLAAEPAPSTASVAPSSTPSKPSTGALPGAIQAESSNVSAAESASTSERTSRPASVSPNPLNESGFNNSRFNAGAASRPRPMIPQSNSRGFSIDGSLIAKVGGGLAALVLVGAGLFFGPGVLRGMGEPDPTLTETDRLVEQVITLAYLSGMDHPTEYIIQLANEAKALESKIEQTGDPAIKPKLLAFHRDVLSRVFAQDGWNESNFTIVEKEWHAIRFKLDS